MIIVARCRRTFSVLILVWSSLKQSGSGNLILVQYYNLHYLLILHNSLQGLNKSAGIVITAKHGDNNAWSLQCMAALRHLMLTCNVGGENINSSSIYTVFPTVQINSKISAKDTGDHCVVWSKSIYIPP